MKSKLAQKISKIVSSHEFHDMFDELSNSLLHNDQQFKNSINIGIIVFQGCAFSTTSEMQRKNRVILEMIANILEAKKINIAELNDLPFRTFANLAQSLDGEESISFDVFKETYSVELEIIAELGFGYRARCSLFEFHGDAKELKSKYVNVLRGETLVTSWNPMEKYKNITPIVLPNSGFELKSQDNGDGRILIFPDIYWDINCNSVSNNARTEAAWMAGVFVSFLRLALPQSDYCHRPLLGQQEVSFGEQLFVNEGGVAYSDNRWSGFGSSIYGQYKVDDKLLKIFESEEIQEKLNKIYEARNISLAFRVANSLGWLARARQTKDFSERLLHNFTALEALLSDNSAAAPVVDTISRSVSVIMANTPEDREVIFKKLKRLYSLRSGLVHRGIRTANELHSNEVENVAENCVSVVLQKCQLEQNYSEFLSDLKKATHGRVWPMIDT